MSAALISSGSSPVVRSTGRGHQMKWWGGAPNQEALPRGATCTTSLRLGSFSPSRFIVVTTHSNDLTLSQLPVLFKTQKRSLDFEPICWSWHHNGNVSFSVSLRGKKKKTQKKGQMHLIHQLAIYASVQWQELKIKAIDAMLTEDVLKWGNSEWKETYEAPKTWGSPS